MPPPPSGANKVTGLGVLCPKPSWCRGWSSGTRWPRIQLLWARSLLKVAPCPKPRSGWSRCLHPWSGSQLAAVITVQSHGRTKAKSRRHREEKSFVAHIHTEESGCHLSLSKGRKSESGEAGRGGEQGLRVGWGTSAKGSQDFCFKAFRSKPPRAGGAFSEGSASHTRDPARLTPAGLSERLCWGTGTTAGGGGWLWEHLSSEARGCVRGRRGADRSTRPAVGCF